MAWGAGLGLMVAAMGVLGYHPYAEDGGLYLSEVKHLLDPAMYPWDAGFVSGHLGAPVFAGAVAETARVTGLSLSVVMLAVQGLCVGGTLLGVWQLAGRSYRDLEARLGAVGLTALAMGMPVAGTSLMLMDPYVTARSVATTLTLLGLARLVDFMDGGARRWRALGWCVAALTGGVLAHPLMGGYGVVEAMVLAAMLNRWRRVVVCVGLLVTALIAAWGAQALAADETADYVRAALTRYYWFLSRWEWYEWLGLVAPLGILGWVCWKGRNATEVGLARMGVVVGGIGMVVAAAFAREGARVHAVARVQPLRCFQVVYVLMLMVLGAAAGERVLRRSAWRWGLAALVLGGGMVMVQRETYPASDHFEWPGMRPRNAWEQAFVWVRENTPKDALFAMDADYVHRPGEDAQGFRAIAERDVLADYSKDGGEASIRPELTAAWVAGQTVQARLSEETDGERMAKLRGTGVTWVVLGREAVTGFACPYRNALVKVCRVGLEEGR